MKITRNMIISDQDVKVLYVTQTKPSDKFTLNSLVYWYKQISNFDYVSDEKITNVSSFCRM